MANRRTSTNPRAVDSLILKICKHERAGIERAVEQLLDILDVLDGDPDLEDDGTAEPWIGWPGENYIHVGQGAKHLPGEGFLNVDCEHDESEKEPWLGWTRTGHLGESSVDGEHDLESDPSERERDDSDFEPSLGWTSTMAMGSTHKSELDLELDDERELEGYY